MDKSFTGDESLQINLPHSYIEESRREENGYLKYVETCERVEDMSPDGRLKIFREPDGDIIVSIIPPSDKWKRAMDHGFEQNDIQVQFCSLAGGGGRSPKTRDALFALMEAIEQDNKERPIEIGRAE